MREEEHSHEESEIEPVPSWALSGTISAPLSSASHADAASGGAISCVNSLHSSPTCHVQILPSQDWPSGFPLNVRRAAGECRRIHLGCFPQLKDFGLSLEPRLRPVFSPS